MLNPGAWTHYAWAIRDALELAGLPAVEVHLSDIDAREEWRRLSVIRDVCVGHVSGQGRRRLPRGARDAEGRVRLVSAARADRLVERLAERELDALLVTDLVNVRYLTRLHGHQRALRRRPAGARCS